MLSCLFISLYPQLILLVIIPNSSTIYNFYLIISAKVCGVIPTTMLSAMQTLVSYGTTITLP